ncbi:MAG TPA: CpaD family pilus assembly protein [Pseudolabrys sp.]|jgi:pilus assembly protein CpaD|nr:CpaD family pilus assembly protein [Pseudolabrys sp.]
MTKFQAAIAGASGKSALRVLAIAGIAAMLAGCYTPGETQSSFNYPEDYRLRHPITLKEGRQTVNVFVSRNRGGLTPEQRADVLAFAAAWDREGSSGIVVDVPRGGATSRAAADTLREIRSILAAAGIPRNAVYVRSYHAPKSLLATIRLNYQKLTAHAGPCGLWPDDLGPTLNDQYTENRSYWNFGCATQRNLAAMVDNPADLVQPRGETPAYEPRRAVAIDKYRKGTNPSGQYDGIDKAKISDLGK